MYPIELILLPEKSINSIFSTSPAFLLNNTLSILSVGFGYTLSTDSITSSSSIPRTAGSASNKKTLDLTLMIIGLLS